MISNAPELQPIVERLEKLEAQNKKLRRSTLIIFIAFSAIVLMGQVAPPPRIVEAQRFVLKDASGNVRAWMGIVGNGSELVLGNASAQPMMRLMVSTDASDLHFFGGRKSGINLGVESSEPSFFLTGAEGGGQVKVTFAKTGPSLTLQDGNDLSAVVGSAQLTTPNAGEARYTSAASVALFGKDKKVVWRAP